MPSRRSTTSPKDLLKDWLRKFGLEYKILPEQTMEASPNPNSDLTPGEKEELEQLRKKFVF